ncbi:hypothetical protein MRX96_004532 [Rhipicephalus microplus]
MDQSPSNGSSLPYSGMASDAGGVVLPLSMAWVNSLTELVTSVTIFPEDHGREEGPRRHSLFNKGDTTRTAK